MNKNLLIFPGGSGTKYGQYKLRNDIIINEAKRQNYKQIESASYPGQNSKESKMLMSMKSALHTSQDLIKKYDKFNIKFDIIAFCWGTCVCLNAINSLNKIINLDRIVLYGCPPYWIEYDFYIANKNRTIMEMNVKGINVDEKFFQFEIPFEILLKKYRLQRKLLVICGTEDKYSSPEYMSYLKKIVSNEYITFIKIEGCEHVQVEPNKSYLKSIFT